MKPAAVLLLAAAAVWAQAPVQPAAWITPSEKPVVSLTTLTDLEKALDKKMSTVGGNQPVMLLGNARALYLEGYGVVITQEISLIQTPFLSPFRPPITPQETARTHQRKLERLPLAQQTVREMWTLAATKLTSLPDNEQIVMAERLLYQSWEDTKGLPGVILVRATRKDGLAGNLQLEEQ
jgi:hypothetical protein